MFLLFLLAAHCVFYQEGSCEREKYESLCYGHSLKFPSLYAPSWYNGPLYFNPRNGGPSKLLMDNSKAEDPRLEITPTSLHLRDLTEDDRGTFSIFQDNKKVIRILRLNIEDCAEQITRKYGSKYEYKVPSHAEFIEFTSLQSLKQPKILWNRTDPDADINGRGRVTNDVLKISDLTQKDNGYYNFRQNKNRHVVSRILLTVKENTRDIHLQEDDQLHIVYPYNTRKWTATFTPQGEDRPATKIENGRVVRDYWLNDKIQVVNNGIQVFRMQHKDSGTFDFRDSEGNLVLSVHVEVEDESKHQVVLYIIFFLVLPGTVCCCRLFCKKKPSEKSASETPAASTAAHNHNANQPSGPSYSATTSHPAYSRQPVAKKTMISSNNVPVHQPFQARMNVTQLQVHESVNGHADSTHSEAAPLVQQFAPVGSYGFSSEPEPRFELKGLKFSSTPPLNSDSTICDVYTSDKLNLC